MKHLFDDMLAKGLIDVESSPRRIIGLGLLALELPVDL